MPLLKVFSIACVLGSSVLMGCATHSADFSEASLTVLQSHHWNLQQAVTAQGAVDEQWYLPAKNGQSARSVVLDFSSDQRLSVERLCNSMSGSYEVQGERIHIGRLMTTMMSCNDAALMKLERSVGQQLPQAMSWKIQNSAHPILELKFDSGAVWQLKGTPTYEALYGGSEQVFLEVAPQKVACSQPAVPNAMCLQVREVTYDDRGIKQSTGSWMNYDGVIEGYKHQNGVRNIIRLKRFTRGQAPAGSPKYVDVLDLVVESEVVR